MTSASAVTLACPECRHENEIERIYCHSCGARLDRSALSARKIPKAEAPEQVHKRLQGMFSQRQARIRSFLRNGAKLLLAAITAAILAQMLTPPDIPAPVKSDTFPPQVNMDLEMMVQYHRPPFLRYSEEGMNGFLANALKTKNVQLTHPFLEFKRALLRFGEGTFTITVERSIFGFSIYTGGTYSILDHDGKLVASAKGGAIGRLPIHSALMKFSEFLFGDVVSALRQPMKEVRLLSSIELHDREVIFAAPK